jgi:hypothetical protein
LPVIDVAPLLDSNPSHASLADAADQIDASPLPSTERWDDSDVTAWDETYGNYLTAKVAKVFPDLFGSVQDPR